MDESGEQVPQAGLAAEDAVERVHYAEGTREEYKSALIGFAPQLTAWMVMSMFFVPTVLLVTASAWILARFGRVGLVAFLSCVAVLTLVSFGGRFWRATRRAYDESMELTKLPMTADGAGRVRCLGTQARVKRLGPVPTEPFEPVIVRVVVASSPSKAFIWTWVVGGVLALAGALMVLRYGLPGFGGAGNPVMSFMYFHIAFGASAGALIATFVFPTYLRITPGRLDVFQFPALGIGQPRVRTHDLRKPEVTVLLNQSTLILKSSEDQGTSFVTYATSLDRLGTSRAILAAAISPHPTPPLSERELLD